MQAAEQMDGLHHHFFCFIYLWNLLRGAKEEGSLNGVTRVLQHLIESNRCAAAGRFYLPLQFINPKIYGRRNSRRISLFSALAEKVVYLHPQRNQRNH